MKKATKNPGLKTLLFSLMTCIAFLPISEAKDILIENQQMKLVISSRGEVLSLIEKTSGQECLQQDVRVPAFSITQYRPYDNELQLSHPAKSRTFSADSVWWDKMKLMVSFKPERNIATIDVKVTDSYIAFKLEKFDYDYDDFREKRKTEIDEFTLFQLPVKNRTYFGEWLNVSWDEDVAINLLATCPYAKIDAVQGPGYRILSAGMETNIKLEGVGAALIATSKADLLNCIEDVERDFKLPMGVESRRKEAYKYSYYEIWDARPDNIDEHIAYAKKGGFRAIQLSCTVFAETVGHFPWNKEYPGGMADLQYVVQRIKDAGMIAGIHIWYNKAEKADKYVSPVPDYRLNLSQPFMLAAPIDEKATTIEVEENPEGCTMEDGRRILKLGNELIGYTGYSTHRPYRFTECQRGLLNTSPEAHEPGFRFGLLDVDTWTKWVRFDQRTSIQQEVAERIGKLYSEAGFDFVYFDGAEDVHPPYWFYTSLAQKKVYDHMHPTPLFSEGALKSHFSWHIITRGNAFDTFEPEVFKQAVRRYPLPEAALVAADFTSIDFGWIGYRAPDTSTIGLQPDMIEYICSRAAAWDCAFSLRASFKDFKAHARTDDNLEIFRKWEDIRIYGTLDNRQKEALRNPVQEHIALKNRNGQYELFAYRQIENVSGGTQAVRAFVFKRNNKTNVVYWHTSGEAELSIELDARGLRLHDEKGGKVRFKKTKNGITVPLAGRCILETDTSMEKVIRAFQNAVLL